MMKRISGMKNPMKNAGRLRYVFLAVAMIFVVAFFIAPVSAADGDAAEIGGAGHATLKDALSAVQSGQTITLLKDSSSSSYSKLKIETSCTIEGDGHTISYTYTKNSAGPTLVIGNDSSNIDVTLKNLTIYDSSRGGKALEIQGKIGTLTLENCTIQTTGTKNPKGINVSCSQGTVANINIINTEISAGMYGYSIHSLSPMNLTITDSKLSGYCGIAFRSGSSGSEVDVSDTEFNCPNKHDGTRNSLGVFVFIDGGIRVNLTDCVIHAEAEKTANQSVFEVRSQNVEATISGVNSVVTGSLVSGDEAATFSLTISGGSFFDDPSQYMEYGKVAVWDANTNSYITKDGYVVSFEQSDYTLAGMNYDDIILLSASKTFTLTPVDGKKITKVEATNATIEDNGNGKYTLKSPTGSVKITVTLAEITKEPASTNSGSSSLGSSVWLTETPTQTPTPTPTETAQPTDTVPTDIPITKPTEEPSSPGFGILAAFSGLGAVAVLRRR